MDGNVDDDLESVQKACINSLKITPHNEFRGKLNNTFQSNVPIKPKKSKVNLNQLIECQSTQGLTISQRNPIDESYSPITLNPAYLPPSSERTPLNHQIELSFLKENINNSSLISAKNDSVIRFLAPDTSQMPLNHNLSSSNIPSLNNLSQNNISQGSQTPRSRSESKRKQIEDMMALTPNNQKTHDFFYHESHFLKDLYRNNSDLNLDCLFETLTLCQASKNLGNPEKINPISNEKAYLEREKSVMRGSIDVRPGFSNSFSMVDSKLEYRDKEEQVVLDFSKLCGFSFEKPEPSENPSQYFMKMKGHKLVYNIYGINDFSSEKKKSFSIVVKSPIRESEVFLLCKGQEDYMRDRLLLEKHEEEMLEAVLKDMHINGLKPLIYAKRSIPEYEAWTYINKLRNLKSSLINQTEELMNLALEVEKDMSLVCVIGLKDDLNEGIEELMKFSNDADINVWIVTGDSKENALSTASAIGLFNAKVDKRKELTSEDQESLTLQLRSLLSEIKNIYMLNFFEMMDGSRKSLECSKKSLRKSFTKSIEDFFLKKIEIWQSGNREIQAKFQDLKNRLSKEYLLLNGKSLDLIFQDPYLKPHFVFLLSLFKKVIAYNLTPRHKYLLTDTVQSLFIDNPSVMAVGDGANDSLMLQTAHIGVELLKNMTNFASFQKKEKLNSGDLQISSLAVLKQLMLIEGIRRLTLLENFVYLLFYKSFLIGWTLFLYNWFCSFTGTSIFSSVVIFLYSFFFLAFTLVIFALFDKPVSEVTLKHFPALYKEALLKKRNPILRIVIKSLIEGIAHSMIIFYITTISLSNSLMDLGQMTDFTMMSFALSTCLIFVPNVKVLFICLAHNLKLIILGFILTIFMYAAFIFLASHSLIGKADWGYAMVNLLNNGNSILGLIYCIWACQLISFVYERYILKKVLYSPVKEKLADFNYLKELKNEQILHDLEPPMDIGTLVKKIFVGAESLDPSIQEMFTPADINVNEIELNRYTLIIKDPSLEQKFNFSNIKDMIKKTLLIYYTSLVIFLIFVIYALASAQNKTIGFICLGTFFLLVLLSGFFYKKNLHKNFYFYAKFLMVLIIAMKIVLDWVSDGKNTGLGAAVVAHISTLNLSLGFLFTLVINVLHYCSYFITLICIYYGAYPFILSYSDTVPIEDLNNLEAFYGVWSLIVLISTVTVISLYSNYKFEKLRRSEFLAKSRMEHEATNIEDILAILVPKFVKDQISQGTYSMQESQDDIAILFCDMCDFDHIITTENLKIVQILDEIFRNFDILCLKHGVQKIETVGKTYMACAGLKACEMNFSENILKTEKTRRLVTMAFEMMKFMEKVTIGKGETIKLKIGIHIGTVIAGVIGHHKPQFSLIGDTVNTTSRVCSTGSEGTITISNEAFQKIKNANLEFQRKIVQAKGKGDLITYQVLKQRRKRTKKESKFKERVMKHMTEIKKLYQLGVRESENLTEKPKNIQKAVNLMKTWYLQNKYETYEERGSLNYNNTFGTKGEKKEDGMNEGSEYQETSMIMEEEILKPSNEIFLTFQSENSRIVQQFRTSMQKICKEEALVHLVCLFAVFLFQTLLIISVRSRLKDDSNVILYFRGSYNVTILLSLMAVNYLTNQRIIKLVFLFSYFYGMGVLLVQIEKSQINEIREAALLELVLIYLIHGNANFLSFIEVVILTVITFTIWIIDFGVEGMISGQNLLFMLTMTVFNMLKVNFQMRHHIDSFNNLLNNESKKQEQNNLVSQLLPFHAFEKLKNISVTNKIELTDQFREVTLLFADIAGFTKYSSSVRPEDVVTMLRSLFTEFDKMCLHHKVYKVYTIGDCYVVMGFLNANHRNPLEEAKNVVKMGLSMIEIIRDVRKSINFPGLDMRIGVHTGEIIGGIIGTDIVRYDIYGRDVLIANKMESNGLEGHIMVSEVTKSLLEKDENLQFRFEKLKDVECKVLPEPISGYLIYRKEKPNQVNFFND